MDLGERERTVELPDDEPIRLPAPEPLPRRQEAPVAVPEPTPEREPVLVP